MINRDVDDFPVGSTVVTPTGRTGVVVAHKGYESRRDPFMRLLIKLDGGGRQDMVQLQPRYVRHLGERDPRICSGGQLEMRYSG